MLSPPTLIGGSVFAKIEKLALYIYLRQIYIAPVCIYKQFFIFCSVFVRFPYGHIRFTIASANLINIDIPTIVNIAVKCPFGMK